ncbi:MAG: hypothetical protein AABZ47_14685 [Planctomycetota bacterium]
MGSKEERRLEDSRRNDGRACVIFGLDASGNTVRKIMLPDGSTRELTPEEKVQSKLRSQEVLKSMGHEFRAYWNRAVNDPEFVPEPTTRYMQFVLWKKGLAPGYHPTFADLFILAAENVRESYKSRTAPPSNSVDQFGWARQVDLVRATNQVLGDGTLNRGVLSRACADGHVETNGKIGQASQVQVPSFLVWITRRCEISTEEQIQIRNAIIGEIISHHSKRNQMH